jgi:hypothetical protein
VNFRTTALLGGLLLLLAGYFYLYEYGNDTDAAAETVFDISQESVNSVVVRTGGQATTLEKIPLGGWLVVDPIRYPADPALVGALVNEITTLSPARTVVDSAADFSEYGLDAPTVTIEISAGLSAPSVLHVGDAMPTGASYYAVAEGSRRVFLLTTEIRSRLDKSTDELRDRQLLHIDRDKVTRVSVKSRISRQDLVCVLDSLGIWRVKSPFDVPAERNETINLVGNISSVRALKFVDDNPTSLREYGLDRPFVTATVTSADGTVDATLSLGQGKNQLFAMSSEFNTVYSLSPVHLEQIVRDHNLYRRVTAFDFKSYNISKLDLQIGPESVSCVKRSFEDWRMLAPVETRADDRTITGLLDSLEVMKIHEYLPATTANLKKYALDQPNVIVTCEITDRLVPARIAFGTVSNNGLTAYVRDLDEEWIYRVGATGFRHLPVAAVDLRDRQVLRYKGFEVNMFEIVRGDIRVRVRRDQKQKTVWKMEEPFSGNADAVSVGQAFSALDSVYTQIFVSDEEGTDLSRFGLNTPSMEVTLLSGGRSNVPEERHSLMVGKAFPGDASLVYVKRRDNPVISLVKNSFLARLNSLVDNTVPKI